MSVIVQRFLSGMAPGDVVNIDAFEAEHGSPLKRILLEEIEGQGFVLNSRNVLGEVSLCTLCDGDGQLKGQACPQCDGESTTVNYGRGTKPYRQ